MKKHSAQTRKTLTRGIPFGVVFLLAFAFFCSPTVATRSQKSVDYSNYTNPSFGAHDLWHNRNEQLSNLLSGINAQPQKLGFKYKQQAPILDESKVQAMDVVALKNVLNLSADQDWNTLASLNDHQPSADDAVAPVSLSTYLSHSINDRVSLSPYFYHGRSVSGSNIGLGVQMSLKL